MCGRGSSVSGEEGLRFPTRGSSSELRSGFPIAWVVCQRSGKAECGSSTARGNAVCGRTARTVWEGAGGNALTIPGPMWIAGWHVGGAPLAYLTKYVRPSQGVIDVNDC